VRACVGAYEGSNSAATENGPSFPLADDGTQLPKDWRCAIDKSTSSRYLQAEH
jgi:hypothetical protein